MSIDDRHILYNDHWRPLADLAGWSQAGDGIGSDLLDRYGSPGRYYHNLLHLAECLSELEAAKASCADPVAVAIAIWFHDAVYDAARADNERASEELAVARLSVLGEAEDRIARVAHLIRDTAHQADPATPDGRLIVDIDLAILGKNPARFDNYDSAIRLEYAHVPDDAYRRGRGDVLRRFLSRPTIYRTPDFVDRLEKQARANLERAVARL